MISQEYDFTGVYRPGQQNLADAPSRLPNKTPRSNTESCTDRYVHNFAEQLIPTAMTTEENQECSESDPKLIQVRQCIENNQLHYKPLEQELNVTGKIILRDNRIVLPTKLRNKTIQLWWPSMDKDIQQYIQTCRRHPCQIVGKSD